MARELAEGLAIALAAMPGEQSARRAYPAMIPRPMRQTDGPALIFDFFGLFVPDLTWEWFRRCVPGADQRRGELQALANEMDRGTLSRDAFLSELAVMSSQDSAAVLLGINSEARVDHALVALVRRLRSRHPVAVLSNSAKIWLEEIIAKHGLASLFDVTIVSSDVGELKPHPAIFAATLGALEVEAVDAVFIDDRGENVAGAARLGIRGIVYSGVPDLERQLANLGVG